MITSIFLLDWALIGVSLFNALLLLWLGLVVFLNAERRTWGLWLLDGGLMLGALFFVSHTVILGHELTIFGSQDLEGWWRLGWYPVILAPLAWYVVILWYSGFWEVHDSKLRRRHRASVTVLLLYAVGLLAFISTRHPVPTYAHLTQLDLAGTISFRGFPLLFVLYPPFSLICILLPLDAVRHAVPSPRIMGDLARQRARPWLIATSMALLTVALLLTAFMIWVAHQAGARADHILGFQTTRVVAGFDLLLETLIALAVILLGQSVVSHEIFTGTTLPRRGFFRQWRNTVILAATISASVGYALTWQVLPIFSLLLATLLMMSFYALFSWRSFVDRERFMAGLRPFVSSQRVMRGFLETEEDAASRARLLFQAVCEDVLDTTQAHLIPLGALAPLVTTPLVHPQATPTREIEFASSLLAGDSGTGIFPLDPAQNDGLYWAIPLWTERGLIGALLLGPKQDGGLYTQEEIEIARAGAERIIDMLAGEQIARRLVNIQRRRFAETKVLDMRTRRLLHDEILPELHMIALRLSPFGQRERIVRDAIQTLTRLHHQISDLIHTSGGVVGVSSQNGDLLAALRRLVDEEFAGAFDSVTWHAADALPELDSLVQEIVYNAVREVIRNAALHGRGNQSGRALHLTVEIRHDQNLSVIVCDDGVGMTHFPTATGKPDGESLTGSGGGLMLHSTMLAVAGGELSVEAPASGGTRVLVSIPAHPLPALDE